MRSLASLVTMAFLVLPLWSGAQTISLTTQDFPLQDIFTIIKKQTGIFFFYEADVLDGTKPVTVDLKNASLEIALAEIFKGQNLTWTLEDKTVMIFKSPFAYAKPIESVSPVRSAGQVRGQVSDIQGNPISGVSVLVKGTNKGTMSDAAGKFSIAVNNNNSLVFSSVNYTGREIKVVTTNINIILQMDLKPMESMLVGGNMNLMKRRALASSVSVLDSRTLEKIPANTLDQIFRGWVPGVNSFDVGPQREGFPSLSIRGAGGPTSLTLIAVYIDGVEYAGGSGYLSQLDKSNIDRIEVVRGPGAATLYGTGSNGGIVQIFTKVPKIGQTTVNVLTAAGFYKSKWVNSNPFQQMHNFETATGLKHGTLKVGGSYRMNDAYLPDGGEKTKSFYGSGTFNVGKFNGTVSARYTQRNFHLARAPIFDTAVNPREDIIIKPATGSSTPAYVWFNVRPRPSFNKDGITETSFAAINLVHRTTLGWTNKLDMGNTINGSREVPVNNGIIPIQNRYSSNEFMVTTIRYSNILTVRSVKNRLSTTIISGAEYKKSSSSQTITRATAAATINAKDPPNENYGAFLQVSPSYRNVYLTMGLRYEKNNLFKPAWNPRIGITTNFEFPVLIVKPRISWGKGITAPTYVQRFGAPLNGVTLFYPNPDLKAQSQQGFDYGLEVYDKKGKFTLEIVYYDNLLQNLIGDKSLGKLPGNPTVTGIIYNNVGKVANRGWEFMTDFRFNQFKIRALFSLMNSSLDDTTGAYHFNRYSGKPPGTRLIYLPRHTAGLSFDYNFRKLFRTADKGSLSLSLSEGGGIKYFDSYAYYLDVSYGRRPYDPSIAFYDAESKSVFRLGFYGEYSFAAGFRLFAQGSNILNDYKYEFYNQYQTHGASWLFGLKYDFVRQN